MALPPTSSPGRARPVVSVVSVGDTALVSPPYRRADREYRAFDPPGCRHSAGGGRISVPSSRRPPHGHPPVTRFEDLRRSVVPARGPARARLAAAARRVRGGRRRSPAGDLPHRLPPAPRRGHRGGGEPLALHRDPVHRQQLAPTDPARAVLGGDRGDRGGRAQPARQAEPAGGRPATRRGAGGAVRRAPRGAAPDRGRGAVGRRGGRAARRQGGHGAGLAPPGPPGATRGARRLVRRSSAGRARPRRTGRRARRPRAPRPGPRPPSWAAQAGRADPSAARRRS